ncbi:hypothetical protein BDV38DRAFT_282432 [Aspergillus pseudotamarii]|uniref:Uncharacterized protein n=1 Tax=Aspergillus pseudotamarii TaxID=132259 RepID=A0A5N6SU32_ASPPS|nr:uncharacterized protein BDV38DRAFT_282432 [Aspergillus pseudotamarii]KAE8138132.1 hypothetical protein BDV38DRAFT_282432 [Aspergillus pseudotamarii]
MSWHPVSTNRYERAFDSLEKFYWGIAEAGAPLQKQHHLYPQIAAVADETGTRLTYTVPSPEELEAWVYDTFLIVEESSATHLYQTLPPSSLFCLYYLPRPRELLFRTPHWRIDGIGLMYLQTAFLRILADGPVQTQLDGSEAARLAPSLDEAALVPPEATPTMSEAADAELEVLLKGLPGVPIATQPRILLASAAVTVYHTGIPFSVDLAASHDFASLAVAFAQGYKRDLSRDEPRNIFTFLAEYVRKILGLLGAASPDPLQAPAHPELSSVGVVNDYLPAEYEGIARKLEMQLAVNWNKSFYEEEFVATFLDSWMLSSISVF